MIKQSVTVCVKHAGREVSSLRTRCPVGVCPVQARTEELFLALACGYSGGGEVVQLLKVQEGSQLQEGKQEGRDGRGQSISGPSLPALCPGKPVLQFSV